MSRFRGIGAAALILAAVALTGCGGDQGGNVSGTVTFDGQPVEEGAISFTATGGDKAAGGGTIKDGKYTATRVPLGPTKVTINGMKTSTKKKAGTPEGPSSPPPVEELLPAKYNTKTELTFDVKSGAQEKNWELTK